MALNELALFAGAGGGILGGLLCGFRTVCAVEIEEYPRAVLLQRQNDGILDPFPIWDDVCTFDGKPWRGHVDIITGGFPCQDISAAGKGAGITGARSGLWKEFARIIGEVRPRYALVENSPMLVTRGLDVVLCDLAAMGYDARWGVVSAENAGALHKRERCWIVADSDCAGFEAAGVCTERAGEGEQAVIRSCEVVDTAKPGLPDGTGIAMEGSSEVEKSERSGVSCSAGDWWSTEPDVGRVANGVAARVDRLAAIGNGQVPLCSALAWKLLSGMA